MTFANQEGSERGVKRWVEQEKRKKNEFFSAFMLAKICSGDNFYNSLDAGE